MVLIYLFIGHLIKQAYNINNEIPKGAYHFYDCC